MMSGIVCFLYVARIDVPIRIIVIIDVPFLSLLCLRCCPRDSYSTDMDLPLRRIHTFDVPLSLDSYNS